eukprot:SM000073S21471  [mRNA]  locus=s73:535288:537284:+ [translate_table: standard]
MQQRQASDQHACSAAATLGQRRPRPAVTLRRGAHLGPARPAHGGGGDDAGGVGRLAEVRRRHRRDTDDVFAVALSPQPAVAGAFLRAAAGGGQDEGFAAAEAAVAHFPDVRGIATGAVGALPPSLSLAELGCPVPPAVEPPAGDDGLRRMPLPALRLLHWLVAFRRRGLLVPAQPDAAAGHLGGVGCRACSAVLDLLRPAVALEMRGEDGQEAPGPAVFNEARRQHGSFMAFHGTAAENLHSILRCGLLNMSGTRLQKNGAMFGDGVYLTTDAAVALAFSSPADIWERSALGGHTRYLLLCEVADAPGAVTYSQRRRTDKEWRQRTPLPSHCAPAGVDAGELGTYIVVANPDLVRVAFILVYLEPTQQLPHRYCNDVHDNEQVPLPVRAVEWCKLLMLAYIILLLALVFAGTELHRMVRPLAPLTSLEQQRP